MEENINTLKNQEQGKLKSNMGTLVLLFMAGSIIYSLPYFRFYYYDAFVEAFNLNNTQMGSLGSIYGVFAMISYLFGGALADKYSVRKLLCFSLVVTGGTGLILLAFPPYWVVFFISGLWGVTTILTFWPALIKAVRMLASENEQGKAFGFMEGGRGVTNAVHMSLALLLFKQVSQNLTDLMGLKAVIIGYSILNIVLGLLIYWKLDDSEQVKELKELREKESNSGNKLKKKLDIEGYLKVLKMPLTWLIIIIFFTSYSMIVSFYYLTPYATEVFGASAVFASVLTILAQYVRPVAAAGAGVLGDRLGSSKIIAYGFVLMMAGTLGVLLTPGDPKMIYLLMIASIAIYLSMYIIQGLHYSLLEEGNYPMEISGTAVGVIATLGYLPEIVSPFIAGRLLDKFPGAAGYRYYFTYLLILAAIGLVITILWMRLTKERRMEILEMNKRDKKS